MWMLLAMICLLAPVRGPVVSDYAPVGRYGGHWGVDLAAAEGTEVRAPISGQVTFAGNVTGMNTVTITSGDFKVSVSYLSAVSASTGEKVRAGAIIGTSGPAHGIEAVHLSVRVLGRYVDPTPFITCRFGPISQALRLVPYPGSGAHRSPWRDVRSAASSSPPHRGGGVPTIGSQSGVVHAGRVSVAKGREEHLVVRTSLGDDPAGDG